MAIALIPTTRKPERFTRKNLQRFLREYRGLIFSGFVAAVLLIFYVALLVWAGSLGESLEKISADKSSILAGTRTEKVVATQEFARRTRAVQGLISAHKMPSRLMPLIEEATHRSVVLTALHFDVDTAVLELLGESLSFEVLAEQFVIWKNEAAFVRTASLDDFQQTSAGKINFTATLQVDQKFLR